MIEERGRILQVEDGYVWVETLRRSACDSCQARHGCGQSLLQRAGANSRKGVVQVAYRQHDPVLHVGDEIRIGVPEQAVVRGSALVYLFPLIAFFIGAWLATVIGMSEPWIMLVAFSGMGFGFSVAGWYGRHPRNSSVYIPSVLGEVVVDRAVKSEEQEIIQI